MSRVEQIGDCTLYLGDCRDILPTLGMVDHVISDPPYEDELHKAFGTKIDRKDGANLPRNVNMLKPLTFSGINEIRPDVSRACVAVSSGWVIMFCLAEGVGAWRDCLQGAGAKWDTTCFWVKPDSAPRFNGQGPARGAECFVTCWAGTGYRSWNGGGKRGIYTYSANTDRDGHHPTEKPALLMRAIVADFTKPGQSVCDPFMGSGTTGVASASLGRSFIGIEREPTYFDIACRRIEAAYKQPRLFDDLPPQTKAIQPSLLDDEQ